MSPGQQKEELSQPQQANGALKVSVWSKVLPSFTAWGDKDEFLDCWGVFPLRGFLGIAGFCLINVGVVYLYFSNYLQIDEEDYRGTWALTEEGFMTWFSLFMVLWIVSTLPSTVTDGARPHLLPAQPRGPS
ncbi:hypothetical protein K5549_011957 [Capra hircus]|uniref:Uncharacterized protein n=1 Tax=Capra hircus TaxID=9925 RepID=A0A452F526_CAPHI|nr:hypothetical protein K5549_011957 [Capra hircus]